MTMHRAFAFRSTQFLYIRHLYFLKYTVVGFSLLLCTTTVTKWIKGWCTLNGDAAIEAAYTGAPAPCAARPWCVLFCSHCLWHSITSPEKCAMLNSTHILLMLMQVKTEDKKLSFFHECTLSRHATIEVCCYFFFCGMHALGSFIKRGRGFT